MTITKIEISHQNIPLKTPFITALRRVEDVQSILVILHSSDGFKGIGAAPPTKAITGEDLESIVSTIKDHIAPALSHRKWHSLHEALNALHKCCKGNSSSKAAIDMALYDLYAKSKGQPLYEYLGAQKGGIETYVTISLNTPEQMLEDAKDAYMNGYALLKIKVGANDGDDLQRISIICENIPEATVLIDANQAWSLEEAIEIIHALHYPNISMIEQPVKKDEYEAMQTITEYSPIPILADESVFSLQDTRYVIENKMADLINIKLMKCGGISKAIEIIKLCEKNNIECMMGSMLEAPVSIAAAMQLSLTYPDTVKHFDLDSPLLYKELPEDSPLTYEANRLQLH